MYKSGRRGRAVPKGTTSKASKTFGLRLTSDEIAELRRLAEAAETSPADFARRIILPAIGKRHPSEVVNNEP